MDQWICTNTAAVPCCFIIVKIFHLYVFNRKYKSFKKNEIEISKIPIKYMQSGTFNTSS